MLTRIRARWKLRRLIKNWLLYRDEVLKSTQSEGQRANEKGSFLKLKANLATELQGLTELIPADAAFSARKEIAEIIGLLKRDPNLRLVDPPEKWDFSTWDQQNFERLWHGHYIFLNELKGLRWGRKPAGRSGPPKTVLAGGGGGWNPPAFAVGGAFRVVLVLACLALVVYLVGWGFGVTRDDSGRFVSANQTFVGRALESVANFAVGAWEGAVRFFHPVVETYGDTLTIALFGVLLLVIGYWLFARG